MFEFNEEETITGQIKRHIKTLKGDFNAPDLASDVFGVEVLAVTKAITALKKEGHISHSGYTTRKAISQGGPQIKTWVNGESDYIPTTPVSMVKTITDYLINFEGDFTAPDIAGHFDKRTSSVNNIFTRMVEDGFIIKTTMLKSEFGGFQQQYARSNDKKKGCPFNMFNYRMPPSLDHLSGLKRFDRSTMAGML